MTPIKKHIISAISALFILSMIVSVWVLSAQSRLKESLLSQTKTSSTSIAIATDSAYCSGPLKAILRKVLTSCGLLKGGSSRGCQPVEAKSVAAMSGEDFNALFLPLSDRASILQFEKDDFILDSKSQELLSKTFADQKGASYFLVVSRASLEGSTNHNRELSEKRAQSVLDYLKQTSSDPDLDKEVGLLWLGEEYAQLNENFCNWNRSHTEQKCSDEELNRSAFIAWIDCRL